MLLKNMRKKEIEGKIAFNWNRSSIFSLVRCNGLKCNPLRHNCTEVGWICRPSITYFRTVVAHDNFDLSKIQRKVQSLVPTGPAVALGLASPTISTGTLAVIVGGLVRFKIFY